MKKAIEKTVSSPLGRIPKIGVWAWSFIGVGIALLFIAIAFAAVSEILQPIVFAAVLAVIFKPLCDTLRRYRLPSTIAAGVIVIGLLLVAVAVISLTAQGVSDQLEAINASADAAIATTAAQTESIGIDQASLDAAKAAVEEAKPMIATGVLSGLVTVLGSLISLAAGIVLGSLVMYYFLKDGKNLRRSLVNQFNARPNGEFNNFIGESCQILRNYWRGRTIMSLIVAVFIGLVSALLGLPLILTIMFVNFIGGYIPYIGAFIGGGLAVIIALGEGGLPMAALMLVVVLVANLALENFVQPGVMSSKLDTHPVIVLIVTALGGLMGGLVGLILAVPVYVIAMNGIERLRSRGVVTKVKSQMQPTVKQMLD